MPLWNLTLEKKEEILKQQQEKNTELKNIQMKSCEQLWLDDLDEFKVELERVEEQEKADLEGTVKKSLAKKEKGGKATSGFNVSAFLKRNNTPTKKYEYLPSASGERVVPKIDAALLDKCLKEAQQKELSKAKKEEEGATKVLNLVDVISNESNKFTEEEMKQIRDISLGISNPNKTK